MKAVKALLQYLGTTPFHRQFRIQVVSARERVLQMPIVLGISTREPDERVIRKSLFLIGEEHEDPLGRTWKVHDTGLPIEVRYVEGLNSQVQVEFASVNLIKARIIL